jgi:long-chain acyl-CoA synthetase
VDLAQLIGARLAAAPDGDAVQFDGRWFQWSEIQFLAARIQDLLEEFAPGSGRVGVVARNRPAVVAALAVLLATRRPIVMVDADQPDEALAAELAGLELCAAIAVDDDLTSTVLTLIDDAGIATIGLLANLDGAILHRPGRPGCGGRVHDDAAIHVLTSGTTGKPKRIPLAHDALNAAAAALIGVDPDSRQDELAGPDIIVFPMGNISGLYFLLPALAAAHRVVLMERFTVDGWLTAVRSSGAAYSAVPPAAIKRLLEARIAPDGLGVLRSVGVGSAPLDPDVQEKFEHHFGIPVMVGYGATEFAGVVATWTIEDKRSFGRTKRGSVGRAAPGVDLKVVDMVTGDDVPEGTVGQLVVLAPRVDDEPIRTNDLASIDQDGFLFLHGRTDQVINRGGFKVHPDAVSRVLSTHPSVHDAAVVGVPHTDLGEVPVAVIELCEESDRPTDEEMREFARSRLRPVEVPLQFLVVDALPRTPTMKVAIGGVREVVYARKATQHGGSH